MVLPWGVAKVLKLGVDPSEGRGHVFHDDDGGVQLVSPVEDERGAVKGIDGFDVSVVVVIDVPSKGGFAVDLMGGDGGAEAMFAQGCE
jgi:hypothetical protein